MDNQLFNLYEFLNIYIIKSNDINRSINNFDQLIKKFNNFYLKIVEINTKNIINNHLSCINNAKKNSQKMILIIEDTTILHPEFDKFFLEIIDFLYFFDKWKIYLGNCTNIDNINITNIFEHNNITFIEISNADCYNFVLYHESVYDIILNSDINENDCVESLWKNNNISVITSVPFISTMINLKMPMIPNELIVKNEDLLVKYLFYKNNIVIYIIDTDPKNKQNLEIILNMFKNYNCQVIKHDINQNILFTHKKCLKIAKNYNYEKIYIIHDNCIFEDIAINNIIKINNFLNDRKTWNIFFGMCGKVQNLNIFNKIIIDDLILFETNNAGNFNFVCYNKNTFNFFINFHENITEKNWNLKFNALISIPFICYDKNISEIKKVENSLTQYINNINNISFFVINLQIANERMNLIYKSFKNYNIIRIDGISHKLGYKGCLLSHLKCIQYAKNNKLKYIWVLEDDCSPNVDFINRFLIVNEYLDKHNDWNLYLGGCNKVSEQNILDKFSYKNENFIKVDFAHCMHMVCYNEKIYDYFLKFLLNTNNISTNNVNYDTNDLFYSKPIDIIWRNFTNAIISVPFLAYQTSEYSYIEQKNVKYYRSLKKTEKILMDHIDKKVE